MLRLYTHSACLRHDPGPGHVERPARLQAVLQALDHDRYAALDRVEAPAATREQLLRVHGAAHIAEVLLGAPEGEMLALDQDTVMGPGSPEAALHAAGAVVAAVDAVLGGSTQRAFCAVRPPGHHAERTRAMGFCYFNNVAVAAKYALSRGLERVAVLDFDLHYGNGTADCFLDEPRALLLSTYQHPLYPYWSGVLHAQNLVDVPLKPYTDGPAFRAKVVEHWLPALEAQRPQMLLVSAGFDAHLADPLGDLRLQYGDFQWLGTLIRDIAAVTAQGRVLATLEGGYDLTALARSVESFLTPFVGGDELPA